VSDKSARILVRVRLVDDPCAEVGEEVRVGVGVRVGAVECQLIGSACTTKADFDRALRRRIMAARHQRHATEDDDEEDLMSCRISELLHHGPISRYLDRTKRSAGTIVKFATVRQRPPGSCGTVGYS